MGPRREEGAGSGRTDDPGEGTPPCAGQGAQVLLNRSCGRGQFGEGSAGSGNCFPGVNAKCLPRLTRQVHQRHWRLWRDWVLTFAGRITSNPHLFRDRISRCRNVEHTTRFNAGKYVRGYVQMGQSHYCIP